MCQRYRLLCDYIMAFFFPHIPKISDTLLLWHWVGMCKQTLFPPDCERLLRDVCWNVVTNAGCQVVEMALQQATKYYGEIAASVLLLKEDSQCLLIQVVYRASLTYIQSREAAPSSEEVRGQEQGDQRALSLKSISGRVYPLWRQMAQTVKTGS